MSATEGVVVVGVDGSDGSMTALRWAIEEARVRGAVLRVVYAWSYLEQPGVAFHPDFTNEQAEQWLADLLAGVGDEVGGVTLDPVAVCDLPARALLEAGATADLLVVGSRGLGGFRELLLGSVSSQLVHHAPCPVVVVPGDERDRG